MAGSTPKPLSNKDWISKKEYFSISEIASECNTSTRTIRRIAGDGEIPAIRGSHGAHWRFARKAQTLQDFKERLGGSGNAQKLEDRRKLRLIDEAAVFAPHADGRVFRKGNKRYQFQEAATPKYRAMLNELASDGTINTDAVEGWLTVAREDVLSVRALESRILAGRSNA